ncbi:MAG TPA: FKBP-type peptidyl-prolyl cis-trans isomerase [Gemmatimonadaceae bacterium]|nr:FKBP-type peptidyl-prolyl cis-trans isomerase [Gemmatimonadaceae bacterium]
MHHLLRRLAVAAALPLAFAACGSGSTGPDAPDIENTTFAPALGVDLAASTKTSSGLYYRDITVGAGAVVSPGQEVSVHYTGWLSDGTKFDENTAGEVPLTFHLGGGQVIAGWDQGVAGMRVGGKRQLIIPPSLGYGSSDYGPIPGNSILVFDIEVVSAD